jgi:hypothetical protein
MTLHGLGSTRNGKMTLGSLGGRYADKSMYKMWSKERAREVF